MARYSLLGFFFTWLVKIDYPAIKYFSISHSDSCNLVLYIIYICILTYVLHISSTCDSVLKLNDLC